MTSSCHWAGARPSLRSPALQQGRGKNVMETALGVVVMLPGVVAAVSSNQKIKRLALAASFLVALAAVLGLFR